MAVRLLRLLKTDSFGRVELVERDGAREIRRVPCGGRIPGSALVAGWLARREQRLLARLAHLPDVCRALGRDAAGDFRRSYVEGVMLFEAEAIPDDYFDRLLALVASIHAAGIAHDDLAKEANLLVTPEGRPAIVDFQVAVGFAARPGALARRFFAMLRREDRRHVLKQKLLRRPDLVTAEERRRIERKSLPVCLWSRTLMKPYQRVLYWFGLEPVEGPRGR